MKNERYRSLCGILCFYGLTTMMRTPKDILPSFNHDPALQLLQTARRRFEAETGTHEIYEYAVSAEQMQRAPLEVPLDDIPEYIGIKGGVARTVLALLIEHTMPLMPPRDIDLVVLGDSVDRQGYDAAVVEHTAQALAAHCSPRDAQYGYGAEYIGSIDDYMSAHDFTINQVLLTKERHEWLLYTTTQAVIDMAQHIIRPTYYEHNAHHHLGSKLALKAVRLLAELQTQGIAEARIEGLDLRHDVYGDPTDDYFMQALQLDKALERGYPVAEQYVANLRQFGLAPDMPYDTVESLYQQLVECVQFEPSIGARATLAYGMTQQDSEEVARLMKQVPDRYARDYV